MFLSDCDNIQPFRKQQMSRFYALRTNENKYQLLSTFYATFSYEGQGVKYTLQCSGLLLALCSWSHECQEANLVLLLHVGTCKPAEPSVLRSHLSALQSKFNSFTPSERPFERLNGFCGTQFNSQHTIPGTPHPYTHCKTVGYNPSYPPGIMRSSPPGTTSPKH